MKKIVSKDTIPYNFNPRDYQMPLLQAMDGNFLRAYCLWHRRAGKDKVLWNLMIKKTFERKGLYFYFLPTYTQGRKIIWDGIDNSGFKFINHIPIELRAEGVDKQQMKIPLKNGSIMQIIGTDNFDAIRGTNPVGCVFSEWAFQNPIVWEIVKPILRVNGGWAIFNTTPNGANHAFDLWNMVEDNEDWFCEKLTINDTGVVSIEEIQQERREGMSEDMIQQEYYCSFEAANIGSYYSEYMRRVKAENRICGIPYDEALKVDTWWDLGMDDATSIWFSQQFGKEVRLIDYYENAGEGLKHYLNVLEDKGYRYGTHHFPHDMKVRELGTGKSREDTVREYGLNDIEIHSAMSILDGIEAVRGILQNCWFDKEHCQHGINCLKSYRKEYDIEKKIYKSKPLHDWSCHGADAFRLLAVNIDRKTDESDVTDFMRQRVRESREEKDIHKNYSRKI
jgi:hypothetical protein